MGDLEWGYLEDVEASWPDMEDRVILDVMDDLGWPQERFPEMFILIPLFEVCQEGQEGGYLEDIEGSWMETWRTRVIFDVINDVVWP